MPAAKSFLVSSSDWRRSLTSCSRTASGSADGRETTLARNAKNRMMTSSTPAAAAVTIQNQRGLTSAFASFFQSCPGAAAAVPCGIGGGITGGRSLANDPSSVSGAVANDDDAIAAARSGAAVVSSWSLESSPASGQDADAAGGSAGGGGGAGGEGGIEVVESRGPPWAASSCRLASFSVGRFSAADTIVPRSCSAFCSSRCAFNW